MTKTEIESLIRQHKLMIAKLEKFKNSSRIRVNEFSCPAESIIDEVNKEFNVECRRPDRGRNVCESRFAAMHLMKNHTKLTQAEIAMKLGRANHTTVHHGLNKYEQLIQIDDGYKEAVQRVKKRLANTKN
jgi:chromosomal replication initiation ATPase DnaA